MKLKPDYKIQFIEYVCLTLAALATIVPLLLVTVSSFKSEKQILLSGYTLIPNFLSLDAYNYLWKQNDQIFRAYFITVIVTALGTAVSLFLITLLAYPLSRKDLPGRNFFNFYVFFTMLFNGGLVPTYLMYTQYFGIKNTLFALIVPGLLMSAWYVLLTRAFLVNNIPIAVIESAQIDGANELLIFVKIILPMGRVIIATVGLFVGIDYWNDWYNGMIYLTDHRLFSIQNLLYRMISDIQFLSNNAAMAGHVDEMAASIPGTTVRMAIAVIGVLPIAIIYPFVQNNFVKGIAIGAVKG